jgi:hypothetical protein
MTPEQVIAEVTSHLAQRSTPKDHLVPLANFLAMLVGGERRTHGGAQDIIRRRRGGREALEAHRQARQERKAAYEVDLLAARAAGLSVAVVAEEYGRVKVSYSHVRRIGVDVSPMRLDPERVRLAARPGMTITELAAAAGYPRTGLENWLARGHLDVLFVMRKRKNNVFYVAKVRRGGEA